MLINNKKVFCVVGFASSSLIYAKKIFKKKLSLFNTNKLNFHAVDNQNRSIFDVLKRFKIDIFYNFYNVKKNCYIWWIRFFRKPCCCFLIKAKYDVFIDLYEKKFI